MSKATLIQELLPDCTSFTQSMLEDLDYSELLKIDATDLRWTDDWEVLGYESIESAISAALFATYEDLKR